MKWFGIAVTEPEEEQISTPVGVPCGFCLEPIDARDRGCAVPNAEGGETPYHFECHIRLAIGSIAHQKRRCSCYGGTEHDPPGMTLRQAAKEAFAHWVAYSNPFDR